MLLDALVTPVALGFVLGLQHATDPDHLVAVATIVTRERRFAAGALVGALWGLGHMATLTVAGVLLLVLNLSLGPSVTTGLELLVAAMLVILGLLRLGDAARGISTVGAEHLTTDHDHGHAEAVHSHSHAHGHREHGHPHVHPSQALLAALSGGGRRVAARAALVGAVHGMAGTAAVSLLVMATLRSAAGALLYLVVFGVGTIAGMTVLTAAMAYPVALAARFHRARKVLAVSAGVASIGFGLFYAVSVVALPGAIR
jgi:high-affinity nickel-transport protein